MITIIVLLILAGITISALSNDNGVFTNAKNAKSKTAYSEAEEEAKLEATNLTTFGIANKITIELVDSNADVSALANEAYKDLGVATTNNGWTEVKYTTSAASDKSIYLKNVNSSLKKGQDGKFQDGSVIFQLTLSGDIMNYIGEISEDAYNNLTDVTVATGTDSNTNGGTGTSSANAGLVKSDGTALDAITSANLSRIYGTPVKYGADGSEAAKLTWRVFYVDYDGRYGDENTVYLKSDPISLGHSISGDYAETSITTDTDKNSATGNKIWQMNPAWAAKTNLDFSTVNSNANAKGVAYLMDPTKWTTYLDRSVANYVIGAPSIEMYCDSYATFNTDFARKDSTVTGGTTKGWTSCNTTGYAHRKTRGILWTNGSSYADTDRDNMYCKTNVCWWLGSPSSNGTDYVHGVNGNYGYLLNGRVGYGNSVCLLVSLKTKVQ